MFESSTRTKEKWRAFESMLLTGRVLVWPHMLYKGLVVPDTMRAMSPAPLAYTPDMRPELRKDGIHALMSFGGRVVETFVPWRAVFFMASKRGHSSWMEDAPAGMIDDSDSLFADADADFFDEVDAATLHAAVMARAGSDGGASTTSETAADDPSQADRPDAGGVLQPGLAGAEPTSGTSLPRASSPSLTVIAGGAGQDSEG